MSAKLVGFSVTTVFLLLWRIVAQGYDVRASNPMPMLPKGKRNAETCIACHSTPAFGGSSRVKVAHFGAVVDGIFKESTDSGVLTHVDVSNATGSGQRVTLPFLGDGLVEAVTDSTFQQLSKMQASKTHNMIRGSFALVNASIANDSRSVGRFGWKSQHVTIESASAHALANELGIDNYLFSRPSQKVELLPEDKMLGYRSELRELAAYIRSTDPIMPDEARLQSASAQRGSAVFDETGCAICHVRTLRTAKVGSRLAGGQVVVDPAQADREFHPFSDYLLHDVGTGDGIMQNARPADYDGTTANKFRTAPLWGIRYRSWLMHDGRSITYHQAIERHTGEASGVIRTYNGLTPQQKEDLRIFLDCL